jgi:hypothetical protein
MTETEPDGPDSNYSHPGEDNWGWEFRIEDFVYARICDDEATAAGLPDTARTATLNYLGGLRRVLAEHSIYVSGTRSWGRCYTCEPASGVPCVTIIGVARIWATHPDAPTWLADRSRPAITDLLAAGTYRRLNWPQTVPEATA